MQANTQLRLGQVATARKGSVQVQHTSFNPCLVNSQVHNSSAACSSRDASISTTESTSTGHSNSQRRSEVQVECTGGRRSILLAGAATLCAANLGSAAPAQAGFVDDLARGVLRPAVAPEQAVVVLIDAKSVLREIQALAATPADSDERFRARALWPSFAGRLRLVAEAAPVVAAAVTGGDKEATLSELYGGKAGEGTIAVTDAVYQGLGKVLTISGRTIRPEAQATPVNAAEAEKAVTALLEQVPVELLAQAVKVRDARRLAAAVKLSGA